MELVFLDDFIRYLQNVYIDEHKYMYVGALSLDSLGSSSIAVKGAKMKVIVHMQL